MASGTTGAPYNLPYPTQVDIADVPADVQALANAVVTALNGKLSATSADGVYQRQIRIVTSLPADTTGFLEGDIVFVVP